jgi:ABC-type transporter Mla subunit MlaD
LASKNTLLDNVVGNLSQVATDLAGLIGSNHSVITSTIDSLQVVAADVQKNQTQLASSLSGLGAGLAPYIQISQYGQWFAVQTIYTCLANQTACSYYEPGDAPPGSGPGGSPPSSASSGTPTTSSGSSALNSAAKKEGTSPVAASSIGGLLGAVAGQSSSTTTPTSKSGS